jgi:diguanylate cyclase
MGNLDEQITAIIGAAAAAAGYAASYTESLTEGARSLSAIDLAAEARAIVTDLIAQTKWMADHTTNLEASLADASAELSSLRSELEKANSESATDALTSLPNRRSFDSRLTRAVAEAAASHEPLSLAFCDVDHFKQFNDTWGHHLGDEVLRFIGMQMAKHFGDAGLPARFGGEEFVVLLPKHDSAMAVKVVERFCDVLRARVLKVRSDGREIGKVTLSVGVATLLPEENEKTLVERADQAMYAAKQGGRNRVVCAKPPGAKS